MNRSSTRRARYFGPIAAGLAIAAFAGLSDSAEARQAAPVKLNLEGGTAWINSGGPIHARDLKGKVVVLDFWTYCCINCHHVLPDLAKLEQKYRNELVVIGVHTPKFPAERITANVREKVREYGIKHPVVSDSEETLWNHYGVRSWPTIGVFDTKGDLIFADTGEGHYDELDRVIGEAVASAKKAGTLDESPVSFHTEEEKVKDETPLRFPGKVLADAAGNRLFVSDTGHNRLVIADLTGKAEAVVGDGSPGLKDGSFAQARFNRPQGMCLIGDVLYVADVENHAIRAVDLKAKAVETISGTGNLSNRRSGTGPAKTTGLNSPWDLIQVPGTRDLIVAMAGPHQLWKLDLDAGTIGVWAGSGMEDIEDGAPARAAFAQPSGLATDGRHLFVADSEGSAVRSVELAAGNKVTTLIGLHDVPNVLFSYDDKDGPGPQARLQHCLGLAFADGKLYVADTYNNKVKVCDLATRSVRTLVGSRAPGSTDSPPLFYQPGGLSVAGETLYVADSNNSAIRAINLQTRAVTTLAMEGLKPPAPPRSPLKFPRAVAFEAPSSQVAAGKDLELAVRLTLPAGTKLNAERPMPFVIQAPGHEDLIPPQFADFGARIDVPRPQFSVKVPLTRPLKDGESITLKLLVSAFVCKSGSEGYCKVDNLAWTIPIVAAEGGPEKVTLTNEK